MNENIIDKSLIEDIKGILEKSRKNIVHKVNTEMLLAYWNIGKLLTEHKDGGDISSKYGKQFLRTISKELGRGFSISNLQSMRRFYLLYKNQQTLSVNLSWSHYCELLLIEDENTRAFYQKESQNSNWSVRELRRQIDSSLFERLLLSQGKENKEKVLELSKKGQVIEAPSDILKEPYVFEFLGLPEHKPILEKDLENALLSKLENFLLELGRGFMFVGSQYKMHIGNTYYHVDLVFYNKILKAYVLIDLKIGTLKFDNIGQMNGYLNYFTSEVNDLDDNKPIGIILCANSSEIVAEYALGGLDNNIFTSKYTLYIPNKNDLIKQVQDIVQENHLKLETQTENSSDEI